MKDGNGCGAPSMRLEDTGVLTEDKDAGGLTQEVWREKQDRGQV